MSWFDAASFTSYAKTALASAQKSIDKVLDIDDGGTGTDSSQATAKIAIGKGNEPQKSSSFKTSTPKPTSSLQKSLSKERQDQNDSTDNNSGDFWSSFLGSPNASSNNKTPDKKSNKSREPLGRKKSDSRLATERQSKKNVGGKTDADEEIKKDVNDVSGKSNLLETTQDNTSIKAHKKNRNIKSKESRGIKDFKANSKQEPAADQSKRSDLIKDKNVASQSVTKEESFVDVCLEQTNPNLVDNTNDNELISSPNTQKVHVDMNDCKTQEEIELEKRTSSGELDNDIEDGNSESITDVEPSLLLMATSTATANKETPTKTSAILEPSEHLNEGITEASSDAIDLKEEQQSCHTVSEEEEVQNSDTSNVGQEIQNSDTINVGDELQNTDTIDIGVEEVQNSLDIINAIEEVQDSNIVSVAEGLSTSHTSITNDYIDNNEGRKEPSEGDCVEEVVQGILFKVEDDLQEESSSESMIDNEDSHLEVNSEQTVKPVEEKEGVQGIKKSSVELPTEESNCDMQEVTESGNQSLQVQQLLKEISDLKELVNARESKMVSLSKENIDYQETNTILRSQIDQLETIHSGENEEFEELREEFTTRIATAENKCHETANERDNLRTELEETTAHLTEINNRQKEEYTTLIAEKDEQIAQLLAEGEKLSKQELQSNTVIKKLRAKEKENDNLIKKQTKKLKEYEEEVKRLTDILTSRDDYNSKQEDAINKLNAYVKKQEEQLSKQSSELEDATEKVRSMQVALDNAYKEMTTLQKQTATADSTIQEAVLSTEMKAKEELRIALEKARREFHQESEMMALQVTDLQASLTRSEQQGTRREEHLRQEIKHFQQRLQEAEDRNQELAASVSHATRPLLRQIENLQTTHSGQAFTWEKVEKNLTERLNDAQNQLLQAQEKEHIASQSVSELNARIARLESQVSTYRAERSRLEADLELERTKIGTLEDTQSRESAKYDAMVKKYQKLLEDANLDKAHLEQQLTVEKSKMDTEVKKFKAALDEKEKLLSRQSGFTGISTPFPASDGSSNQQQDTTGNPSTVRKHSRTSSSSSTVVDGITKGIMGGTTALVERLQAQVRQKDGEIELLQDDVTSLRQSRDSVMEELTLLTEKLERLETSNERYKELKEKHDVLQQRYNAVLQMYGEKEEEAEELRMDLQDVKSMYKQQLEQLFGSTR